MPAYNHEDYVECALDSVLSDDYFNKEIVIVNDGSTDSTHDVISGWIKKNKDAINVRYISRPNKGICRTLNELVDKAEGEYVVLLASDDYLLDKSIEVRLAYLKQHTDKLAVIGDAVVVNDNNAVLFDSALHGLYKVNTKKYLNDSSLKRQIITNWAVPGPVLMVKKEIYTLLGKYDERLKVEDWDFYLRMVSKNLLGYVPNKVSAYRVHEFNLSRRKGVACGMYIQMLKIAAYNFKNFSLGSKLLLSLVTAKNIISLIANMMLLRCVKKNK